MISERTQRPGIATEPRSGATHGDAVAFVAGVLLPLSVFAALAAVVAVRAAPSWDARILRFAVDHYESSTVNALGVVMYISIGLGVAIALAAVIVLLARRKLRYAVFWALAVGGVMTLDVPFK